ncbi:iron-sulfur cluster assembly scaffold protein [Cereibacter sphaeroides]|uniref:iron-sulfur cluster assembly scaffold protein n=1 Tax=Cereibacter sphaeroides TaxID=1063 RepID=UPI003990644C
MLDETGKALDLFFNPRNAGPLEAADAVGTAGSLEAGDAIRLMLRIEAGRVAEARFLAFGGAHAIACGSALTVLITGLDLAAAGAVTPEEIEAAVGGLPAPRRPAAARAWSALQIALAAYEGRTFVAPEPAPVPAPAAAPVRLLAPKHDSQPRIVRDVPLAPAEEARLIAEVIESVRPRLRADGGDVTLVAVEGSKVRVHLTGACSGCQLAALTLGGLQKRLADALGRPIRVIPEEKRPLVSIAGAR